MIAPAFSMEQTLEARFYDKIRDLQASSGRDIAEIVQQQARLTNFELIKSTPPHSKAPINESFSIQKKMGEGTIEMDVNRLYQPLSKIKAVSQPGEEFKFFFLALKKKWGDLADALFHAKIFDKKPSIIEKADFQLQRKIRGSRGRISKYFRDPIQVFDEPSITAIKKILRDRVGWAKAGWLKAAVRLGVKGIPGWITRHTGSPGTYSFNFKTAAPFFEMRNNVKYIENLAKNTALLQRVFRNRIRAMEISIEKAIEHWARKFNS